LAGALQFAFIKKKPPCTGAKEFEDSSFSLKKPMPQKTAEQGTGIFVEGD